MPIGEGIGELLGGVFRVVGRVLFEVVFEFLIRGAGSLILGWFRPRSESDEDICAVVGLLFWGVMGLLVWFLYRQTSGL